MGLGALDGTLMGPGEGIVLGRHAPQSPYKGRIVGCGATGYVGSIPGGQSMPVWTSDDDGKTYKLATGTGEWPSEPGFPTGKVTMPFKGLAECQIVVRRNAHVASASRLSTLMLLPFCIQELTNGSVMVNARNELRSTIPSHAHHRAVAVSHDGALHSCPPSAACATLARKCCPSSSPL